MRRLTDDERAQRLVRTNAKARRWAKEHPDKVKASKRRYLYGIGPEQVNARLKAQDGLCKICASAPAAHVDHDHMLQLPRGLLCGNCNRGLGLFQEDPHMLKRAIDYLALWNEVFLTSDGGLLRGKE